EHAAPAVVAPAGDADRDPPARDQASSFPPVTPRISPLMKRESSQARKTNAGASSAGCAGRPLGLLSPQRFSLSPSNDWAMSGVHTGPGAIALARMPRSASVSARPLVKVTTAPLVAA